MMQQLSLGFGYVLLRITDLFNFLFNVKAINKFYDRISEKAWLKFECDTFDYGYYYAMYTTLMNITTTFGVQVPLLYFLMCVVLVFKLFGDGVKFTNIHGWDLEGSGKLFEVALRRLLIGATISHTLLVNQCFWGKLWRTMSVNAFMMVYSLVVYFLFKKKSIAKLSTILRILEKTATVFKKPTKHDLWNWKFRYNHPFLCNQDHMLHRRPDGTGNARRSEVSESEFKRWRRGVLERKPRRTIQVAPAGELLNSLKVLPREILVLGGLPASG